MKLSERELPRRFWIEASLASVTGALFVLTLFWHEWIEAFGFDPDGGSGAAEWLVVVVLAGATIGFVLSARIQWSRAAPAR